MEEELEIKKDPHGKKGSTERDAEHTKKKKTSWSELES